MRKPFVSMVIMLSALFANWPASTSALDLEKIMKSGDFVGKAPDQVRWSPDSRFIYFDWKNPVDNAQGTFSYDTIKRKLSILKADEIALLTPQAAEWDKARKRALFTEGSSVCIYDLSRRKSETLVELGERVRSASWGKKEDRIFFLAEKGFYSFSLHSPLFRELVHFQEEMEAKPRTETSQAEKYLAQEEKKLIKNIPTPGFSFRRFSDFPVMRKNAISLKKGERVADVKISGDEKRLLISLFAADGPEAKSAVIPRFITPTGYTETENSRAKAGDSSPYRQRILLFNLPEQKAITLQSKKANSTLADAFFSPSGKIIGVCQSQDYHDAWLLQFNAKGEEEKEIFHFHDDAWLMTEREMNPKPLPGRESLIAIMELQDHMRLVRLDFSGKMEVLTPGDFEVDEFRLSDDGRKVIYTSSEGHPGIRNTYLLNLATRGKTALTSGNAFRNAFPAPDLEKLAVIKSDQVTPPELCLLEKGKETAITRSPSPEFFKLQLQKPEVISFQASDGVPVYARLLRPQRKNGAAVIFIHGAGYLQDAHYGWSDSYWREFLFGNLLAEKGYVFFDIDYRGSSGYGRSFRTGIYGHMGGRDLDDLVDGAKYLAAKEGVDAPGASASSEAPTAAS